MYCSSPSSPSPVTQQMTAMSISQEAGPADSDRAEAEEGEEEGTSNNTGKIEVNRNKHKYGSKSLLHLTIL